MASFTTSEGVTFQNADPNGPNYLNLPDAQMVAPTAQPMLATFDLNPEQQAEAKRIADEQAARAAAEAAAVEANRARESRFQYGGHAGGAAEAANRYNTQGIAGQARPGEVIDYTNANADRGLNLGARTSSVGMADLMRARAEGRVPSIASAIGDRDMARVAAEQTSAAASARGPAALALAQQGAAANTAAGQSNISGQTQINAAQERLAAERSAFDAYSNVRGGDATLQGHDADQATKQAAINAAQREANDRYQVGMTQAEIDVQKAQLAAQGNQVSIAAGVGTSDANRDAVKAQAERDRTDKYILGGVGAAAGIGGALIAGGVLGGSGKSGNETQGNTSGEPGSGYTNEYGVPDYNQQSQGNPDDLFTESDMRSKDVVPWSMAKAPADNPSLRAAFMAGVQREMNRDNPAGNAPLPTYAQEREPDMMQGPRGYARPAGGKAAGGSYARPGAESTPELEQAIAFSAKRRTGTDAMMAALNETPMAESNRALAAQPYTYKPEAASRNGQPPGDMNVGPMAQTMAADPVASTAVETNPRTGRLGLDRDKLAKLTAGGVADLQSQVDMLKTSLFARRLGGRR